MSTASSFRSSDHRPDEVRALYERSNLTRRQLLMWIGQRLHPDTPDFHMCNLYKMEGELSPALFERAAARLIEEADALRTVIRERDGVPVQQVLPSMEPQVLHYDLRAADDAETRLAETCRALAARPLDVAQRLFDLALFQLPGGRSAFYLNLHHIVGDGWSLTLVYERLSAIYGSLERGCEPEASPLRPFSAYLRDERAYAASTAARDDEAWWAARTAAAQGALQVYGEPVQGESGAASRVSIDLGAARTERLRSIAASMGGKSVHAVLQNLFTATLTAWLHRIGPNDAVTVGLPFHNRTDEVKQVVGLFMQVLPVRLEAGPDETLRSLCERATTATAEALRHRRFTVDNPLRRRVCDVIMNYLVTGFGPFAGRPIRYEWVFAGHTNVALSVQIHDFLGTGTLHVDLDMQHAAFPDAVRATAARHLTHLLDGMLDDPDRPLADLDLLSEAEREEQAQLGQGPVRPVPADLLDAFDAQVAQRPSETAVICGDERLTWLQTSERANRLARLLQARGVGPDHRVAVCLERSVGMVVAILAVLKAGGGYVPLDPGHPPLRLQETLADCQPTQVITHAALRARLDAGSAVICIDDELTGDASPPSQAATLDDLAYVIYTSGSTGRPKGVEIPRRALFNYLDAMRSLEWVKPGDQLLAVSPLAFDFHVPQLLLPLLQGATVVVARTDEITDTRRLIARIEESRATAMAATPTLWRMLVEAGWKGAPGLRVHCGGEALAPELARALRPRVAELWNVYGPTETTVYSTLHQIEEEVSVGRPIANTWLCIVDERGRTLPRGMAGELLIGGAGLARGYLARPELTAARFVETERGRAYRTGDVARWRRDGTLEVIGRIDHQVKVRGHRIEPGEIEATLEMHPEVVQAVVVARDVGHGDVRLVAYVKLAGKGAPDLRDFVARRLPASMIPSAVVELDSFPVSANGKIDRQALPAPPQPSPATSPRATDLLEYQLARIFEDVLGEPSLSPDDSFFDHGGSSLLAVRALSRIEALLGRAVPVQTFMQAGSPARLAAVLRAEGWRPTLDTLVPLQPRGAAPPFFCVHAFIGDVCRGLARQFTAGQPFYGLQPRGLDGREPPLETVEAMARHYVSEIRRVQPHGPYALGGYCFGGVVAFEMARQLRQAGEAVRLLAIIDAVPRNSPRTLRCVVNGVLRGVERLVELISSRDPAEAARTLGRRLRLRRPVGAGDLGALRAVMAGLDSWPLAYQRIARVHYDALLRYVPGSYDGTITLIRTHERAQRWGFEDETRGWGRLAAAVDVTRVAGTHDEMMNEPHVREVADVLHTALARFEDGAEQPHGATREARQAAYAGRQV